EFVPPDGGLLAWSQVLAGCLVNMLAWGLPATFGVYQLYYRDTLGLPESQVSWIGSLQTSLAFLTCTFAGRLADAGYVRSTVASGAFLVIFGTFMTSLSTTYWQLLLSQGLCTGLGLGVMFMPPLSVINSYFDSHRSLALAISASGNGIGSVFLPATIQYLIPQIGFPWAVRASGLLALVISSLALLLLRPRLPPRLAGPLIEWSAYREAPYALYTLGAFLFFMALYFGFFFITPYARNIASFPTTPSVHLLLLLSGLSVPTRPLAGYLADRHLGPVNTFTLATLLLGLMCFAWTGVRSRAGMYVFAVFFGLANGAAQGVFVGSLASLTADPRRMGTRFGMVCTTAAVATLAGPPMAGAIIDASGGGYVGAQVWAGVVICAGAALLGAARVKMGG
ncbi:major facilitator superfamily domain-containing protein, partial [Schizothecium vesticola]